MVNSIVEIQNEVSSHSFYQKEYLAVMVMFFPQKSKAGKKKSRLILSLPK